MVEDDEEERAEQQVKVHECKRSAASEPLTMHVF